MAFIPAEIGAFAAAQPQTESEAGDKPDGGRHGRFLEVERSILGETLKPHHAIASNVATKHPLITAANHWSRRFK